MISYDGKRCTLLVQSDKTQFPETYTKKMSREQFLKLRQLSRENAITSEVIDEYFLDIEVIKKKEAVKQKIVEAREEEERKIEESKKYNSELQNKIDVLEGLNISYRDDAFYYGSLPISMPEYLVDKFYEYHLDNDMVDSLTNFWRLCALNPNPEARQDAFKYFTGNDNFAITPKGYIVGYRNVNIHSSGFDKVLVKFVGESVAKVKRWKKSTKNYDVYELDRIYNLIDLKKKQTLPKGAIKLGNLREMNDDSNSQTVYTDAHTGTFRIKIGELVTMNRSRCDHNRANDCSMGLHIGNKKFLSSGTFGKVGLLCLINPMDIVSIPSYDTNKFRCCAYLPVSIVEYDEDGKIVEVDAGIFDNDFERISLAKIKQLLLTTDMKESEVNKITYKEIYKAKEIYDKVALTLDDLFKVKNDRFVNKSVEVDDDYVSDGYYCNFCGDTIDNGEELCDDCLEED